MKKAFGISVLSAMLILGQPILAFANTTESRIIEFEDLDSIVALNNLEVRINQNNRLESNIGFSDIKRDIKDMKKRIEDINDQRDELRGDPTMTALVITIGAEKRELLDRIETLERNLEDLPISVSSTDIAASMSDEKQVSSAESIFIMYNKLGLASSGYSKSINTIQNQLEAMQLREKLGVVSHNEVDDLKTKLLDTQTKLESTKLQQESSKRQLKELLNDQDDSFEIGSIPVTNEAFIIKDEEADLKKAIENNYTIKLQEKKITSLQNTLDRAKQDNGLSSDEYLQVNYELSNAKLVLSQQQDRLNSDYYNIIDDIAKKQSNLRLEEQKLEDKRVVLSEANVKTSLGMISQLDLDNAITDYQLQEDAIKSNQIELFSTINSYDWFLKGMPWTS